MIKHKNQKRFSLYIENAGGTIQLNLMDDHYGHGQRLLGAKGSPDKELIKVWKLTVEELNNLIHEMRGILEQK